MQYVSVGAALKYRDPKTAKIEWSHSGGCVCPPFASPPLFSWSRWNFDVMTGPSIGTMAFYRLGLASGGQLLWPTKGTKGRRHNRDWQRPAVRQHGVCVRPNASTSKWWFHSIHRAVKRSGRVCELLGWCVALTRLFADKHNI